MKIEMKATRAGCYEGMPVWRGRYRVTEMGTGFEIGWTLAVNWEGRPIAYADKESALAGARVCAEDTWGSALGREPPMGRREGKTNEHSDAIGNAGGDAAILAGYDSL